MFGHHFDERGHPANFADDDAVEEAVVFQASLAPVDLNALSADLAKVLLSLEGGRAGANQSYRVTPTDDGGWLVRALGDLSKEVREQDVAERFISSADGIGVEHDDLVLQSAPSGLR